MVGLSSIPSKEYIYMNGLSTALTVIGLVTRHQFVLVFSDKLVVIHLDRALVLH